MKEPTTTSPPTMTTASPRSTTTESVCETMGSPSHVEADDGDGSSSSSTSSSSSSYSSSSFSSSPSSPSLPLPAPLLLMTPLSSLYLIDHLRFMREQEEHYRINPEFLSAPGTIVTPKDRRAMCSWSYQIADSCSICRGVAVVGVSYLNRFVCAPSPRAAKALRSLREYQLASVSCLVIALKCRGGLQVGTGFVADTVCQGMYSVDELNAMEIEILRSLA
jgi:hypothetical protein